MITWMFGMLTLNLIKRNRNIMKYHETTAFALKRFNNRKKILGREIGKFRKLIGIKDIAYMFLMALSAGAIIEIIKYYK